jgi:predicted CoA-binding protein
MAVFHRAEPPHVARRAAAMGAKALLLQLGIVSPGAPAISESAGMDYVEDERTAIVPRYLSVDAVVFQLFVSET